MKSDLFRAARLPVFAGLFFALLALFAAPQARQPVGPTRATAGPLIERLDVFQTPAASYVLSSIPAGPVHVHLNGVLLCGTCGDDYTLTITNVAVLAFTGTDTSSADSLVIQVEYWSAQ